MANNAHKDLELLQRDETQSTQITMLKYWSGTIKIIHKIKIMIYDKHLDKAIYSNHNAAAKYNIW